MTPAARCLLIMLLVGGCSPLSVAQGFNVDVFDGQGAYQPKWDSVQDRLVLYRNEDNSGTPAVRLFGPDGSNVAIYPLLDLPSALWFDAWDAAATPEGGVVIAAVVGYTPRGVHPHQLKHVLLTYDRNGALQKFWEVSPQIPKLIAVLSNGDVFAFGDSTRQDPYPLLLRYSPNGAVLGEFLPSDSFSIGDEIVANNSSPFGDNRMFVRGDRLFLWIGHDETLLQFSATGNLISRVSFANAFSKLTEATESNHIRIESLTASETGSLVAQVQLWPKKAGTPVRTAIVEASDGNTATLTSQDQTGQRFLGRDHNGELIFLQVAPLGKTGTIIKR